MGALFVAEQPAGRWERDVGNHRSQIAARSATDIPALLRLLWRHFSKGVHTVCYWDAWLVDVVASVVRHAVHRQGSRMSGVSHSLVRTQDQRRIRNDGHFPRRYLALLG